MIKNDDQILAVVGITATTTSSNGGSNSAVASKPKCVSVWLVTCQLDYLSSLSC